MKSEKIIFKNEEHRRFYEEYLQKCRVKDTYHKALVYCLGINRDTRQHAGSVYDFGTGYVKTECLKQGWVTSGSERVIRMAFNLYCGGAPSIYDYDDPEKQLGECANYAADELFCCGNARYFWEAVKIRYPEYCGCEEG